MKLLVMRHGFAGDYSVDPRRERERPLTVEGRAQVAYVAQRLREWGQRPRTIYASFYERTIETADLIGVGLGTPVDRVDALQPHMPLDAFLRDIMGDADIRRPMIVGHRDNLEPMIERLTGQRVKLAFAEVCKLKLSRAADNTAAKVLWTLRPGQ